MVALKWSKTLLTSFKGACFSVLFHHNFCVSCSINGDGAAEPVSDNLNEGEKENEAEEFSSSWPTAFTSTPPDTEESDAPKQVA